MLPDAPNENASGNERRNPHANSAVRRDISLTE